MTSGSPDAVSRDAVVPALGVVVLSVVVLLGPVGWIAFTVVAVSAATAFLWPAGEDPEFPRRTNCSACGSPNGDGRWCDYCGHALR